MKKVVVTRRSARLSKISPDLPSTSAVNDSQRQEDPVAMPTEASVPKTDTDESQTEDGTKAGEETDRLTESEKMLEFAEINNPVEPGEASGDHSMTMDCLGNSKEDVLESLPKVCRGFQGMLTKLVLIKSPSLIDSPGSFQISYLRNNFSLPINYC